MTNRKEKHIEDFLEVVNKKWNLNLNESEFLESVFILLFNGDIKKISTLINSYFAGEYSEVLDMIPRYVKEDWAECNGFMDKDECPRETYLSDFNNYELLEEIKDRGYTILETNYNDIVSNSMFKEWRNLFENLTMQERQNIIKNLKL